MFTNVYKNTANYKFIIYNYYPLKSYKDTYSHVFSLFIAHWSRFIKFTVYN